MAKAIAADLLAGSMEHVGVEVWFGERRLFVRGAVPERPLGGCRARRLGPWGRVH